MHSMFAVTKNVLFGSQYFCSDFLRSQVISNFNFSGALPSTALEELTGPKNPFLSP